MNKTPVKIILPGGGVKCAYQIGFLNALLNNDDFFNKYEVIEINGSSGGAIVGSYAATGELNVLHEIIVSYTKLYDVFKPWFNIPYVEKLPIIRTLIRMINLFICVTKKSLLNPYKLYESIDLLNSSITDSDINKKIIGLDKFNCVVTNLTEQKIEYINGTNKLIKDYIKASSTLWMLCPPYVINNNEYMDGGLCELYPMGCN
jgi:predicted acylesterase/phospholipase RssA